MWSGACITSVPPICCRFWTPPCLSSLLWTSFCALIVFIRARILLILWKPTGNHTFPTTVKGLTLHRYLSAKIWAAKKTRWGPQSLLSCMCAMWSLQSVGRHCCDWLSVVWRVWQPILLLIVYASSTRWSIFAMHPKCKRAKVTPKKGLWRNNDLNRQCLQSWSYRHFLSNSQLRMSC